MLPEEEPGVMKKPGLSARFWALVVLFMTSLTFVLAAETDSDPRLSFDSIIWAIDTITVPVVEDSSNTEYTVLVVDQVFGISNFSVEYPANNVTKRWNGSNVPLYASCTR